MVASTNKSGQLLSIDLAGGFGISRGDLRGISPSKLGAEKALTMALARPQNTCVCEHQLVGEPA